MYYLVFGNHPQSSPVWNESTQSSTMQTTNRWEPVDVYEADTAEQACQAAARDNGHMGDYFGVEGFPWGVHLLDTGGARKFGATDELTAMQKLQNRTRELERQAGLSD